MRAVSWLILLSLGVLALMGAYYAGVESSAMSAMIRFMGMGAFFLLCVSLVIGPLAVLDSKRFGSLIEPRRAVGLASFVFLAMHFILVMSNYFEWNFGNVIGNFSLFSGLIGFLLFVPLVITSCDYAISVLGQKVWKYVQDLTYIAFVFGFYHYLMKASGPAVIFSWNLAEAFLVLFGVLVVVLQVYRFYVRRGRGGENTPLQK